jgi:RNA polymerase sigma-70 factor, ECF subfamily
MDEDARFDDLIGRLRAGDQAAATEVFQRFSRRLIGLARTRLEGSLRQKVDAEDVMLSALRTFFRRHGEGQFSVPGWDELWRLLSLITLRKCGRAVEYYLAECRDVRREAGQPLQLTDDSVASWVALARDPTPEEAAMLGETIQHLLRNKTDRDRKIIELILQEESTQEISRQTGCSERTVERVRKRLRDELEAQVP